MGTIFTLTPDIQATVQGGLTDLIQQLGKQCRLLYPPRQLPCTYCAADPIGQKASDLWVSGLPVPFPNSAPCPQCNGAGTLAQEATETITLLCHWSPQPWQGRVPAQVQLPQSILMTKGLVADLPRVLRARRMDTSLGLEGLIRYRFELDGEPIDPSNIVPGAFFEARWRRVGA